jgi:hypothetical protein
MRLSDAGVHRGKTKVLYPNHRPLLSAKETNLPCSLEPIVRSAPETRRNHHLVVQYFRTKINAIADTTPRAAAPYIM